jgi:hypothetical protein
LRSRVLAAARPYTFNYVAWEAGAISSKAQQEFLGYHAYIPDDQASRYILDYFALQRQAWALGPEEKAARAALQQDLDSRQALVEHLIEAQVSSVLRDEGFARWGQVLPPVTMHFLAAPDLLVISPRAEIRQAMTLSLVPRSLEERARLEAELSAALPDLSLWITPIGGVGVWPAMVRQTDRAVVAFEITAHEWAHHYLIFFPLGLNYFTSPDTRLINETTATIVGNEVGNLVIERFYADYLATGEVYLQPSPDYRALLAAITAPPNPLAESEGRGYRSQRPAADFLLAIGRPAAAQLILDLNQAAALRWGYQAPSYTDERPRQDQGGWISHTRLLTDYLLSLGRVEAAELAMETGRQVAGLRVLNQAWFAFNVGYQANPAVQAGPDGRSVIVTRGGGGDPLGPAIYEIRARAGHLQAFLKIMRGLSSREAVLAKLEELRARDG